MNKEKWQIVKDIFSRACDVEQSKQAAFVSANSQDEEVVAEVMAMLTSENESTEAINLTNIVAASADELTEPEAALSPGDIVEQFTIVSCIGEGGMGSVFLAKRTEGEFDQWVAIKISHQRHLSQESELRFKQERQILASLQHKNIASLIGGGETSSGKPYIILEYVDGIPITDYCDQHQLEVDQRLALFKQVLAATEYAHQNLIVHRDIKPSNVLVTKTGDVKLLDFGIAKLITDSASELQSDLTQEQVRVLTPGTASPEQVLGEQITTRSDVYGLGTLLMHLLTGESVFASSTNAREMESFILDKTPVKPSLRCRQSDHAEIRERAKKLKGDLDVIVMKALQKAPDRRYSSIAHFADDITRYTTHYPILAKPDSMMYKAKKYLQRNTASTTVGFLFFVSLIVFSAVIFQQSTQIQNERDRALEQAEVAQQTANFMLGIFEAANPYESNGLDIPAGDLLKSAITELEKMDNEDQIKAQLLVSLAQVYGALEDHATSEVLINQAIEIIEKIKQSKGVVSARTLLETRRMQGQVLFEMGNYEASQQVFNDLLASVAQESMYSQFNPTEQTTLRAKLLYLLATVISYQGDDKSAASYFKNAIELIENANIEIDGMATYYVGYAHALRRTGEFELSEYNIRKAITLERKNTPPSLDLGYSLNQLASTLINLGKLEEALDAAKEGFVIRASIVGEEHVEALASQGIIARVYDYMNRLDESLTIQQQRLKIIKQVYGQEHPYYASTLASIADIYLRQSNLNLSEQNFEESLQIMQRVMPEHFLLAKPHIGLGRIALKRNQHQKAISLFQTASSIMDTIDVQDHVMKAQAVGFYAIVLIASGQIEEGEKLKQDALNMYLRLHNENSIQFNAFVRALDEA